MLRLIVIIVVWWFSISYVMSYSSIWQSRAHPSAGVEMTTASGESLRGTLSRDWNGDWVLVKEDHSVRRFSDLSSVSVSFPKPSEPPSFWKLWRSWAPVLAVSCLFMFIAWSYVGPLRNRLRQAR